MARDSKPKFSRIAPAQRRAELIDAGIRCLARRGLNGFTISQICAEAGVSPGLVIHHFGSKDGLLTAVYDTMFDRLITTVETGGETSHGQLDKLIVASFPDQIEDGGHLRVWLALWGEIASNPPLLKAHRRQFSRYRAAVETAIAELYPDAAKEDRQATATLLIALIDGLWLEWCIDPKRISPRQARRACSRFVAAQLRPMS